MDPHTTFDPLTLTWSGQPARSLHHPDASVAAILLEALARLPLHTAQICSDGDDDGSNDDTLTNGELRQLAIRVALGLRREQRIGHGDVVALVARNSRLVAPLVLGSMALAAPLSAISPLYTVGEFMNTICICIISPFTQRPSIM